MFDNDPTMNIRTPAGQKVRYAFPENGYPYQQDVASAHLQVGGVYTVERTEIDSWTTDVYLKEFPDVRFNSVLFENL